MTSLMDIFVTVKPDMDKFGPEVTKKLARIDAGKEGKKAGDRFGVGFSKSLPAIGGRVTSFFKTGLGTAAAVAGGAVLGGGLIAGFTEALNQGGANAKFQAQLGLSDADSAKAGKLAGELYRANYGDSISGVNDAIKAVVQNTDVALNSIDLSSVTKKVLDLSSTFDLDLGQATRGVSNLMRNGLAKDATQALDIITKGFQSGADKSEDFLDTLNEYGTQFRKLGIDGTTATGLISQGLKAGARDGDTVADALKEFSIRAIDGSKTTSQGFKSLGLDADKLSSQIAKGGKPASAGLQLVLDKLKAIKDPVKQQAAAVALFGTKAEDLGKALFALDPKSAVAALGQVAGAADKMDKTLGSTPQAAITGFFRSLRQNSIDTLGGVISAFATGEKKATGFQGVLQSFAIGAKGIFDKVKLGAGAFRSAFSGEGVTSDGFVGAMERIGGAARTAFDFFKTDVLPRLKDFADTIAHKVVPFVAALATNLATNLKPILLEVFGFIRDEVVPRLKEFGQWVGDKIVPKLASLATSLSKNKDFLIPFVATLGALGGVVLVVVGAMKAWAIIQTILNAELLANPIGLIVVAIALLVGGIIYAYKHSEKFRDIVQGAFHKIQQAAQIMAPLVKAAIDIVIGVFNLWWNYYAKPILKAFWEALKFAWARAQDFGRIVAAAFNAIKNPAKAAIKFVIDKFLGLVGAMIDGAAKAFGWVPGLGPKLKAAAAEFKKFRDGVNNALDGIDDQTITVTAKLNAASIGNKNANDRRLPKYRTGGPVFGAGTATSDSIDARLSNGEHVWTAKEVSNAGGHSAVESMRKQFRGFAAGGAVALGVNVRTSSSKTFAKEVAAHAVAAVRPAAQALANKMFALSGTPGSVRLFRGVHLNDLTIARLRNAEQILGRIFHITQGSYSTRVAASGSTHAGGGVMDTDGPGGWSVAVSALRKAGFAAWHRTPSQGPWGHHIHSVAIGDPSESAAAKAQVRSFQHGGNGLGAIGRGGMAAGGPVGIYDKGGRWPSGTVGINTSGKTETVIPGDGAIELSDRSIDRLADALARRPVMLDGRLVDSALSRTAVNGGY